MQHFEIELGDVMVCSYDSLNVEVNEYQNKHYYACLTVKVTSIFLGQTLDIKLLIVKFCVINFAAISGV